MKKGDDDLDAWMKGVMKSPAGRSLREEAETSKPLPEELVARYRAGMLPPHQEQAVGARIAMNEMNLRFLSGLDTDIQEAGRDVADPPRRSWVSKLRSILVPNGLFEGLRLAGAAAAAMLVVLAVMWPGARPPSGPLYRSPLLETSRGVDRGEAEILPDGTRVERVDHGWTLQPIGTIERLDWFVWNPLPGRSLYRFQLYSPRGEVLFDKRGIRLPYIQLFRSVATSLQPDSEYTWVVNTEETDDSKIIRAVGRFRLAKRRGEEGAGSQR